MDQRILQGQPAAISFTKLDYTGTPLSASGVLTVGVTAADGSVVLAAGSSTTPGSGTGVYTRALTAAQTAQLNVLTATWTDAGDGSVTTTTHEIVGGFYVSVAQIRAYPNLSDTTKFPDSKLIEARMWFEEQFEDFTGVAWVPRYARQTISGNATNALLVKHWPVRTVRSVRSYSDATTYTTFSSAELADIGSDSGRLVRNTLGLWDFGTNNYVIEYEHGYSQTPNDISDAALVAIRDRVLTENVGNRQFSVQTEAGVVRSSLPGPNTPFGLPFVDEVALRRNERVAVG